MLQKNDIVVDKIKKDRGDGKVVDILNDLIYIKFENFDKNCVYNRQAHKNILVKKQIEKQ